MSVAFTDHRETESAPYSIRGVLLERRDNVSKMNALLFNFCLAEWHFVPGTILKVYGNGG